jgi:hypothetical protein
MSRITNNPLVEGARGNFGKQFVYKKRGRHTHIARMPVTNNVAEPTVNQTKVRDLFAEAAYYAKGVLSSPELKNEYKKKAPPGASAYNMAFRDYVKPPVVKSIDTGKYTGAIGSTITVSAKDDFRVAEVVVSIRTAAGVLVEEGNAILNPINRNKWTYTVLVENGILDGTVITATASDLPGNKGVLSQTINPV